ncbi:frizzled-5-like [Glandiceps talaboti]
MQITLITLLAVNMILVPMTSVAKHNKCGNIPPGTCSGIGYNMTKMPNLLGQDSIDEVINTLSSYEGFIETCGKTLKFVLCAHLMPICIPNYKLPLLPCRSTCDRAFAACNLQPELVGISCHDLPVYGDPQELCMDYRITEDTTPGPAITAHPNGVTVEDTGEEIELDTCQCRIKCNCPGE